MNHSESDFATATRALDANANRAAEALRVIEDYIRFGCDDAVLSKTTKELRHRLQTALAGVSLAGRLACRDTTGDVGTTITTASESARPSAHSVAAAACKRLQQALRSMEEFAKVLAAGDSTEAESQSSYQQLSAELEQLRYQSYTLEKALHLLVSHQERLANSRLCVLVDCCESTAAFEQLVTEILAGGADMIQLRDKTATDRTLLERGQLLRELTRNHNALFIMNDRVDLALLAAADGVHVGQQELSVAEVRRIAGERLLVGVSTHCLADLEKAIADGASYVGIGPMFLSTTKNFSQLAGLAYARQVAEHTKLPAYAIGGIDLANLDDLLATGIGRVAIRGSIVDADSPQDVTSAIVAKLEAAKVKSTE